jgi:hypothetical protein
VGARAFPLTITALLLAACPGAADPVAKEAQSVIDRTVPRRGHMIPGDSLRRHGQALRATWRVEVEIPWDAYADWVSGQLPEYRLAAREADTLLFSRVLEGDVYYVALKRVPNEGVLVEARFEAHPF